MSVVSKADLTAPKSDFRSSPNNGHHASERPLPKSAKKRLMQQQTATIPDPLFRRRNRGKNRACNGYASVLARSFGSMLTDLRHGTEA